MKPRLAYAILIFVLLVGFTAGILLLNGPTCTETYRSDGQVLVNGHKINVQIVRTSAEQQKGLGGKKCLAANQGMLFRFSKSGFYPFWMKDTHFPIDIVWIDSVHQVADVQSNIQPSTYPKSFTNSSAAEDVLELSGGEANKLGIETGSYIYY